jgi:hypothetical protein
MYVDQMSVGQVFFDQKTRSRKKYGRNSLSDFLIFLSIGVDIHKIFKEIFKKFNVSGLGYEPEAVFLVVCDPSVNEL